MPVEDPRPARTVIEAGLRCPKCGTPPADVNRVVMASTGLVPCERCGRHSPKEAWLVNIGPVAKAEARRVREA